MQADLAAPSFPFLKLSRELRDEIYQLALQPDVDFTLKYRPWPAPNHDTGILSYELIVPTQLLLINKEVSAEARNVLSHLTTSLRTLLSASIVDGRINAFPSPAFLSICQSSRFIFFCSAALTLSFLTSLSLGVRVNIRSIVITSDALYADDYPTREAWSISRGGPQPREFTPFTTFLRSHMPRLQEVALFVPSTDSEEDFYCSYAPEEICGLLEDGLLDTVRLLLRKKLPAGYDMMECSRVRQAVQPTVEWLSGMGCDAYLERVEASKQEPDKFVMMREDDERSCTWPKAGTVIALRRPN